MKKRDRELLKELQWLPFMVMVIFGIIYLFTFFLGYGQYTDGFVYDSLAVSLAFMMLAKRRPEKTAAFVRWLRKDVKWLPKVDDAYL